MFLLIFLILLIPICTQSKGHLFIGTLHFDPIIVNRTRSAALLKSHKSGAETSGALWRKKEQGLGGFRFATHVALILAPGVSRVPASLSPPNVVLLKRRTRRQQGGVDRGRSYSLDSAPLHSTRPSLSVDT